METSQINPGSIPNDAKFGDYVVGTFDPQGRPKTKGVIVGDSEGVSKMRQAIINSALHSGATMAPLTTGVAVPTPGAPVKQKRGRKPKKQAESQVFVSAYQQPAIVAQPVYPTVSVLEQQQEVPVVQATENKNAPAVKKKYVVFWNEFGRIKSQIVQAIDETNFVVLVFENEEAVTFTPQAGQIMQVSFEDKRYRVFYGDTLFTWLDGQKQVMVLFKKPDDSEEQDQPETTPEPVSSSDSGNNLDKGLFDM